ncbi:MAG: serine--tRNA ligase [Parachlamydiales bacterium]|jgi:seryl-tRNA synthetase
MLDIRLLRKDHAAIEQKLKTKDPSISLGSLLTLDEELRTLKTKIEALKASLNEQSKKIGLMKRKGEDTTPLMNEVSSLGTEISVLEPKIDELEKAYNNELASLPNIPMDDVKVSQSPADNVVIKTYGEKPEFTFPFKNHVELNEKLHLFDFKAGAKLAGSGWPVYRNWGARLEWALINYMLSQQIANGFMMWMPPLLVKPEIEYGAGQLPKFEMQQFKINDPDYNLYLIPTSEVPLNGIHLDEIINESELPLKYTAYTPCFRREAGAAGSQERGLIRMHQFNKVEMFCFTKPEDSNKTFDEMMRHAEKILENLNIHYRSTLLVTGDMSFGAAKTVDIEVWLPGQNRYYEVSSISNCTDYQARRSQTRYRKSDGKLDFVHTLNGSGLATSRLMVAILENNQNEDGSINIPKPLQPYLDNLTILHPTK